MSSEVPVFILSYNAFPVDAFQGRFIVRGFLYGLKRTGPSAGACELFHVFAYYFG